MRKSNHLAPLLVPTREAARLLGIRPLYGLPDTLSSDNGQTVSVVEGEKCAEAAKSIGLTATTSPHGSQSAGKADWTPLAGRNVAILPDNDKPGRAYANDVASILTGLTPLPTIRIVDLPGLPDGGDIADWLDQRDAHQPDELRATIEALVEDAEVCTPPPPKLVAEAYQPFPVQMLPEPVRGFVIAGSKAIGCDPSYIALPALAASGAAIGNSRRIQPKRGWQEPPIVWAVIVGESGDLKTPAFRLVMRPVHRRQKRAFVDHAEALVQYEIEVAVYEREFAVWRRGRGRDDPPPTKPERPVAERSIVSDTTVEVLAPILNENPRGVLLARDEAAGWFGSHDAYKTTRGAVAPHWLSIHNAEAITVDRKTGTPRTIYVPSPAVCITGGIQPRILGRALGEQNRENGMAARFLLAYPPRRPKRWTDADIQQSVEDEIMALLDRLYGLEPDFDDNDEPQPIALTLTAGAQHRWVDWYNAHAQEQVDLTGDFAAAWSK